MANNSKIEWCHHTDNLWWGCKEVHEGCDNCYARVLSNRWNDINLWGNNAPRKVIQSVWKDLMKQQKAAEAAGERHRVFVGSMMDIFERAKPLINSKGEILPPEFTTGALRDVLFKKISDGEFPNLIFLLLTKRPSNIKNMIPIEWLDTPPDNVMYGTSPVNQETADKLIPQLLEVRGKHFLSVEPQLDEISLKHLFVMANHSGTGDKWRRELTQIDWVINGGESGSGRRPFNTDWGRSLRDECKEAGVPFFFKQVDKILPIPEDLLIREFPKYHAENFLSM